MLEPGREMKLQSLACRRRWVLVGLAACAWSCANGGVADRPAANDVDAGDTVDSGGSIINAMQNGDASVSGDGNIPIKSTLPPPWQYYATGNDYGFKDPKLAATVKDQFAGATTGAATLVYPLNNSLHPMNLGDITFQWTKASGKDQVWRIDVAGGTGTFHFFVPCTALQCIYKMPESEWIDLGKRFAGQEVTVTLNGTDGKGGEIEASMPTKISSRRNRSSVRSITGPPPRAPSRGFSLAPSER